MRVHSPVGMTDAHAERADSHAAAASDVAAT
jgi:hypothetical protein